MERSGSTSSRWKERAGNCFLNEEKNDSVTAVYHYWGCDGGCRYIYGS